MQPPPLAPGISCATTRPAVARGFRFATAVLMIVIAVAGSASAAPSTAISEDVPIPGGIAALARALGIDPLDRARCVAELTRLIYADPQAVRERPDSMFRRLIAHFETVGQISPTLQTTVEANRVPMPLPAAVWSRAVFRRPVAAGELFAAVMSDARAALVAHGLAALDDETLRFLSEHPAVVTRLYERDAPVFAAFAGHLQIRNNRVVPPGGDRAVPLWEALLDEKVAHPEEFVRELFARDKGRIAYLYDIVGHLDSSRAAFGLGLWIDDARVRVDRFRALALTTSKLFSEWDVTRSPFVRPAYDLLSMFSRIQVAPTGAPGFPASRWVWARAMADGDLPEGPAQGPENLAEEERIDAAWLAEMLLPSSGRGRIDRLDQFAFGQRVFAGAEASEWPDVIVAIRAFPRFRMLALTLDRMGVRRAVLYAALARQAQRVSSLDEAHARPALAQFQGAIALIARLARVKTIDRATADTLLGTVAALPFDRARGYLGAFAPWLQFKLRPALHAANGSGVEEVLLDALAGATAQMPARPVSWEGQQYLLDFVTSEAARLRRDRERQGGASIDVALELHRVAQTFAAGRAGLDDIHDVIATLSRLSKDASMGLPVNKTIEKLVTIQKSRDLARAAQLPDLVLDVVDIMLGEALLSFSYAVDWGDPQGAARLARQVSRRHDFGLAKTSHEARVRTAWALPRQVFERGVAWRVEGAVLGLDVAFAPLALRRIKADPPAIAPVIGGVERDTFVTSLALMDPLTLQDADRDAIADAIARGRRRVEALGEALDEDGSDVAAVLREIAMDGWRARALAWTLEHDSSRLSSLFSMTELLYLGGGRDLDLHSWGMSAMSVLGCMCLRMPAPGLNTALIGRPQTGVLATTVADLNLRVAVVLHELRLPAALAKAVLASALQEYVDEVKPSDVDDWLTLVRTAQGVSRERLEDYIAAATSSGPFMPASSGAVSSRVEGPAPSTLPLRRP